MPNIRFRQLNPEFGTFKEVPPATILEISCILFAATVFRTAFGFGEALISVPLLALLIPVRVAAPIAVLASILIATFVVLRDWKHIHLGSASKLLAATLLGIPLGLLFLRFAPETIVKGILALVLFCFSLYSLLQPRRVLLRDDRLAWLFGFVAGICGGSYGVNGPPLAIYGSLRGWEPARFRATLQGYFLPASALGMSGYYFAGLWTAEVSWLFVYSLPAIVLGIFVGRAFNKRLNARHFGRMINFGLLLIALVLSAQIFATRNASALAEQSPSARPAK